MYTKYIEAVRKNTSLSETEWNFKSDKNYRDILEHVDEKLGTIYFNEVKIRFSKVFIENKKFLAELCKENDKYGKPLKSFFPEFSFCSPTNLRYILHSLLILEYAQKINLNDLNIIEIGGGYGGLCFFLNKLSRLFDITIKSHTIFDLEEVSQLQSLYLNKLQINNFKVCQLNNFKDLNNDSFLISNYAFSEIPLEVQKEYAEKVIRPFTSRGFLCWNFIPLYQFIEYKLCIDKATRVPCNQILGNNINLSHFELSSKNNWIEETIVTY